jgi:hypothetical protein
MSMIGDILVKFTADFAQFATGMADAQRQIGAFGQKLDQQNGVLANHGTAISGIAKTLEDLGKSSSIDQFMSKLDGLGSTLKSFGIAGAAAAAAIGLVAAAVSKVRAVEDYALAVDGLQSKFKLTSEQAQVLQLAAQQTGVSADDLKKRLDSLPGAWTNLVNAARNQNLLRDNLSDAAAASKTLSAAWADFLLALEPSGTIINATIAVLTTLTKAVHGLAEAVNNALTIHTIDSSSVPEGLAGIANAYGRAAQRGPQAPDPYGLAAARAQAFRQANPPPGVAGTPSFAQGVLLGSPIQFPKSTFGDQLQQLKDTPTPTPPTGGGGKTDEDNIEAQIKRYQALDEAAKKTATTIEAFHATNIEDFEREVKVQQEVDTIAAKLGAKYTDASDASKKALHDQIALYEEQRSSNEKMLQSAQQAADIERKYGDGTAQAAKTQQDLNRAQATGIAQATSLARATKVAQEANEQARLEAQRYSDNLDSLAAGFEHAANAYARANDLYNTGEQAFGGLITSMGEGLDALAGKSTKTFNQIAADFALMLAKLALQAAVSQIFKTLFGSISFGSTSVTGETVPAYLIAGAAPPARASGGPVYPGTSYLVGESGPERFVPTVAGQIVPNAALNSGSSGGGVMVNVNMSGTAPPSAQDTANFARRLKQAVQDTIQNEQRPGGTLYRGAG